jgi:hypothetical protein
MHAVLNLFEYENLAKARLAPTVFDYYAGPWTGSTRAHHRAYECAAEKSPPGC